MFLIKCTEKKLFLLQLFFGLTFILNETFQDSHQIHVKILIQFKKLSTYLNTRNYCLQFGENFCGDRPPVDFSTRENVTFKFVSDLVFGRPGFRISWTAVDGDI